jgi:hypothetical protein
MRKSGKMTSTKEVLDHHLKRLPAGDLEGIVGDYAPDAVLITPPGIFSSDGILRGTADAEHGFQTLLRDTTFMTSSLTRSSSKVARLSLKPSPGGFFQKDSTGRRPS